MPSDFLRTTNVDLLPYKSGTDSLLSSMPRIPTGTGYAGGYGQSGIDLGQLFGFLSQPSMTPTQEWFSKLTPGKQALLGGGLALLGAGAGMLAGRGNDDVYRKQIRDLEDTTDEFEMFMDQARRSAPSRSEMMSMRGPGMSGYQAAEASEAAQARAMSQAYTGYNQYQRSAMEQAASLRAQLQALRESRRQQAIQSIGSVVGTAAGMLFPGVGNIAGAGIGAGLSRAFG